MKSVCRVYRNQTPARFTGNFLPWICETPDGKTYCETRECAREVARKYNAERARLIRDYEKAQARANLYEANRESQA